MAIDLEHYEVQDLLDMRAAIERELDARGLPAAIGEIGERLAIAYFAKEPRLPVLSPAPRGTKNVDAISRDGDRYSIKTLMRARKTGTVYPEPEANEHPLFEYMLIVILGDRYELKEIYRFTWTQFMAVKSWDKRMNAWYVGRTKRAFAIAERFSI